MQFIPIPNHVTNHIPNPILGSPNLTRGYGGPRLNPIITFREITVRELSETVFYPSLFLRSLGIYYILPIAIMHRHGFDIFSHNSEGKLFWLGDVQESHPTSDMSKILFNIFGKFTFGDVGPSIE